MKNAKAKINQAEIAKRLLAVRDEIGASNAELARRLGVSRTRFLHWVSDSESANFPAEEAMVALCDILPGLTLDFIYRGKLDAIPHALAIRLQARLECVNPDGV
jgi:transcriptional regulator with XRE-family HTH domain